MTCKFFRHAYAGLIFIGSTAVAYAADAAPAEASALDWYRVVEPILITVSTTIVAPILVTWAISILQAHTSLKVSDAQRAAMQQAAANAAGRIWAGIEGPVGNIKINAGDRRIVAEAAAVRDALATQARNLGLDDTAIAGMIAGKLGLMQATASAGASTSIAAPVVVTEGGATMLTERDPTASAGATSMGVPRNG